MGTSMCVCLCAYVCFHPDPVGSTGAELVTSTQTHTDNPAVLHQFEWVVPCCFYKVAYIGGGAFTHPGDCNFLTHFPVNESSYYNHKAHSEAFIFSMSVMTFGAVTTVIKVNILYSVAVSLHRQVLSSVAFTASRHHRTPIHTEKITEARMNGNCNAVFSLLPPRRRWVQQCAEGEWGMEK